MEKNTETIRNGNFYRKIPTKHFTMSDKDIVNYWV